MATRNVAVMFTDIKGFTARVSESARVDVSKLRATHERLLTPVFAHFGGHVVKTIGDAFLVRFDSPTDAVLCGITIQEVLRQHNARATKGDELNIRVAINAGEVELTKDDIFGETVNIAARLESVAEAGEVYFTEAVYLAMNRQEAPSAEVGEHTFKGIPYPVRVFRAMQEPTVIRERLAKSVELTDEGPVIDGRRMRGRSGPLRLLLGLAGAAAIALVLVITLGPGEERRALDEARAAMAQGRFVAAIDALAPHLEGSIDPEISAAAVTAARGQVEKLRTEINAREALAWLRRELEGKAWMEPLRAAVPRLEGEATAARIRTAENPWALVDELVARYPTGWDAVYHAALALEDMPFRPPCIELLSVAADRGAFDGDAGRRERAVEIIESTLPRIHHGSMDWTKSTDLFIRIVGPAAAREWARRKFDEAEAPTEVRGARRLMLKLEDPRAEEPYVVALEDMTDGFADVEEADASLTQFATIEDPGRRRQVLRVHRAAVTPGRSWSGSHRELIRRNLEALEARWKD